MSPGDTSTAAATRSGRTTSPAARPPTSRAHGDVLRGPIVYVSDGDTIGVRLNGTVTRIRLIGIDAPESKDPNEPVGCFGLQASAIAHRLLPRGTAVSVVTDPTQDRIDRYHRLLAYVFTRNNPVSINEQLVGDGAARVYVYRRNRPPRRLAKLRAAERQAKAAARGLWAACPTG